MFYPLSFAPIYKEMIWGSNRMAMILNRVLPFVHTGESWDVSCRVDAMSIIENGAFTGMSFSEYIAHNRVGVLGTKVAKQDKFPLLVKIIDASNALSVQVHPGDKYAAAIGSADGGKSEMWYIITPPDDGYLIAGLRSGITRDNLRRAYEMGTVMDCLHRLPVVAGDMVNIPAGLIHALTPGALVAEVQQNSDITYRLYDYNRMGLDDRPRTLHVKDALQVADFKGIIPKEVSHTNVINNHHFTVMKLTLYDDVLPEVTDPNTFTILTCVSGCARITTPTAVVPLPMGRSAFIPAMMGSYSLHGPAIILKIFVP